MHVRSVLSLVTPSALCASLAALVLMIGVAPASAQTAEVRYQRAQVRETALREARTPALADLRALATAYEQIPRRFPRSGYADNALWQASGLMQLAYGQSRSARDRDKALQLLTWLRKEYPASTLVKGVAARAADVRAAAKAAPVARSGPPTAPGGPPAEPPAGSPAPVAAPPAVPANTATSSSSPSANRRAPVPPATALSSRPAATDVESPAALPAAAAGPAPVAVVKSIAYTKLPKGDRVTVELTDETSFTPRPGAKADHFVIGFNGVEASAAVVNAASTIRGTFVSALAMERTPEGLQLAARLNGRPRYSTFPLYAPYRLVIDFEEDAPPAPTAGTAAGASPPTPPGAAPAVDADATPAAPATPRPVSPASTSQGDFSLARQLGLGVSRVVIDPGHGGHDPGAQANGVSEAELVLDVALRLEKLLAAQPGFEVVLTRRTDRFVPLEERTAIANRENADLFLSIHANSSPNLETRGIETYFLNFATTASAEALAARENASSGQAMHLLPDLVKAIATSDKVAESRELAGMVQASLMRRVGTLNKTIKDLGVKQAPFVVLIGARMPSILAEVSFLSNKTEASLLKQAAQRQRIAQALADGVLKYQGSLKKVTGVTARSEER